MERSIQNHEKLKKIVKLYQPKEKASMSNFCVAPFLHMYVHKNEGPRVCCMSTETAFQNMKLFKELGSDLKKLWSSDYYKDLRRSFLKNERLDICDKCWQIEDSGGKSDRQRFNETYRDVIVPNVATGNQYDAPLDLDIRPGNLCNLACRMCGPVSSSQIEKERNNKKILNPVWGYGSIPKTEVYDKEYNIDFLLSQADKGDRIKFLGGEPTIMPEVDKFLDTLIEREWFHVPLHFTTNCTNNTKRFIDKITRFTSLSFNYSVDGIGPVLEYIRHPVKSEAINKNVPLYDNLPGNRYSEISFTYQAYNFFHLIDFINWSNSIGVYTRPEILRWPESLSYKSIPLQIREKRLPLYMKMLENMEVKEPLTKKEVLEKAMPVLVGMHDDKEEYPLIELARRTKLLDIARNQHIKDYIPELWELIEKDYNDIAV